MAARYTCGTAGRRQLVAARDGSDGKPVINGIDFLEVEDHEAPSDPWRQRILVVRCFHPADGEGLGAGNVVVDGGVRIGPIGVLGAGSLPALAAAPTGPFSGLSAWLVDLQAQVTADPTDDPTHWLVVLVDQRGDFSTYTLRLVTSADDPHPPGDFDVRLSAVDFSFKVECPSDFDCAPAPPPTAPPEPGPSIDYLAKDYASFRRLMLDRMSTTLVDWAERSPADLGVTLVELLAYAADQLSYAQDAAATEAYLSTARRRTSVRRHVRLLDYFLHEGCNARAWVQVQANDGVVLDGPDPAVPQGTPVLTAVPGPVILRPDQVPDILVYGPVWFETMDDLAVLTAAHNQIAFHTWGDTDCCLPEGATAATLVDSTDPLHKLRLHQGDVLVFEERDPDLGDDPTRRHAVRLSEEPVPSTDPVLETPVLDITWHEEDALPFCLCLHVVERQVTQPDHTVVVETFARGVARGNIVLADHGRSTTGGVLDPAEVDRDAHWRARVPERDLTFAEPYAREEAVAVSASAATTRNARSAVPSIRLADRAGDPWTPQRDLLESGAEAREFVVEMTQDRVPWLRFGDDRLGRQPPVGETFAATWRAGNGTGGNVGAEALARLVHESLGDAVLAVRNPLAASGGTAPEPLERARLHAPAAFRVPERAVTEADWTDICGRHPDVQRAVATLRWTGSWYTVFVTVDRLGGEPVDEAFVAEMLDFLEPYRLAGYDLEVDPPIFVSLDIAISVCVAAGWFHEHVEQALYERFGTGVLSDGRKAFFHPDNFTFGQAVYLSRLIAAAMEVPGVAWVDARPDAPGVVHRFQRLHEVPMDELSQGVIPMGRLEVAQLENDPNRPEAGRLRFYLRGGA